MQKDDKTEQLELGFEERADHVTEDVLLSETVISDFYDQVHKALVTKGLTLLTGPRGCGKTHMMRYTWLTCRNDKKLPLAIYVSFNRYLRLEPLLISRPDALTMFHAWVLGRIMLAIQELAHSLDGEEAIDYSSLLELDHSTVERLVDHLERRISPTPTDQDAISKLSIENVLKVVEYAIFRHGRNRAILLLDDAALTLTPEYLIEFFDIVRVLKRPNISPKASVYPGTTEYGPRFHPAHEGKSIEVWLPIQDPHYIQTMGDIAAKRYKEAVNVPAEVNQLLMYASSGVPRAYLTMLRKLVEGNKFDQATINKIILEYRDGRLEEFKSLSLKMQKLTKIVTAGARALDKIIEAVRDANNDLIPKNEKQLIIGIETADFTPMRSRMFNLLIEAGLLRELTEVSHGQDRSYKRFMPHLGVLIAARGFAATSRGFSPKQVIANIALPNTKHPLRRSITTLLPKDELSNLSLDEPPCQNCGTARVSDSQRFCHNCGVKLVDTSTYSHCLALSIEAVPRLTNWQRTKMIEHGLKTIGDVLTLQDPGGHLRQIQLVGVYRADKMLSAVTSYVDEFLS